MAAFAVAGEDGQAVVHSGSCLGGSNHTELSAVVQLPPSVLLSNGEEETAVKYEIIQAEQSLGQVA